MTIVAMCPYCRAGGVRAPEQSIGASATCPNCGSNFTVVPDSGLPGWGTPKPAAAPAPTDETRPPATTADVTEPSPVVAPASPPRLPSRKGTPSAAPLSPPTEMTFPLLALALFGPAVLATQIPFGRFVALALAVVGGLLAVAGLASDRRARRVAQAALALHVAFAAVLVAAPSVLGLESWGGAAADPRDAPHSIDHATGEFGPADGIDASSASWEAGDVRVTVRSVAVAPLDLVGPSGAKRTTKEPAVRVVIRVSNEGVGRRVELAGWAVGGEGVRLADSAGAVRQEKRFEPGWEVSGRGAARSGVYPGHSVEVVLAFEPPAGRPTGFTLELPGDAVGTPDPIRFTIGESFVTTRRNAKSP